VRNEEVLHTIKDETNILHTKHRRKDNRIVHNLRWNYLLNHVTEEKIKGTVRRGR
jgi:hypothetical protein